ncbi:MAG: formylglycine-generating enzyme family protein [Bacteroides sp.]|nr:formylglycine-generating enzyme family protein [Bacteroides sp.]MBD5422551.1 formylglycine-generating enzyme family protein [Bacteroides sp.]
MKTNKLLKSIMLGGLCAVALLAYAETEKVIKVYNNGEVVATHKLSDIEYFQVEDYDPVETFTVNGVSFDMIEIEGGSYKMGSNDGKDDEKPVHDETVATFQIGKTEVTQELWEAVMGTNPSNFKGEANLPVEMVSWPDCNTFITRLNEATGKNFRLPTEAEWEYAARGGNKSQGYTYSGSNTLDDVAWYNDNSDSKTHPVAQKQPNELGIYDMSGNVYEWTSDKYCTDYNQPRTSSNRVYRGGSWYGTPNNARVAYRYGFSESNTGISLGLRLAL